MARTLRDVMTPNPTALSTTDTVMAAAQRMKDQDIGDVLVCEDERLRGVVTDRDIVVRAIANGRDPASTTLGDICSPDVTGLPPDASIEDAVRTMRDRAIRRLPVVDGGKPVGIVSIGDLAIERDDNSALADISVASPNR